MRIIIAISSIFVFVVLCAVSGFAGWRNLLHGDGTIYTYRFSVWSPNGDRLAFSMCDRFIDRDLGICTTTYLIEIDNMNLLNLDDDEGSGDFTYLPTWSFDGSKLALASDREGNHEIYLLDASSHLTNLTNDDTWDGMPNWSPTGNVLAFVSARNESGCNIFILDLENNEVSQLTRDDEYDSLQPQWSPTGDKIAFIRAARIDQALLPFMLFIDTQSVASISILDSDGSNLRSFSIEPTVYFNGGSNLAWSPDESKIAFTTKTNVNGPMDIRFVDIKSGLIEVLVNEVQNPSNLSWSPDGNRIAYSSRDGLFVVDVATGLQTQVSENPGLTPFWVSDKEIQYYEIGSESLRFLRPKINGNLEIYPMPGSLIEVN